MTPLVAAALIGFPLAMFAVGVGLTWWLARRYPDPTPRLDELARDLAHLDGDVTLLHEQHKHLRGRVGEHGAEIAKIHLRLQAVEGKAPRYEGPL